MSSSPAESVEVIPPPEKKARKDPNNIGMDTRLFDGAKYEKAFPWVYYNCAKRGYICKYCELFALISPSDNSTPYISCGGILGSYPTRRLKGHADTARHKFSAQAYTMSLRRVPQKIMDKEAKEKKLEEDNKKKEQELCKKTFQNSCLYV